MWSYGLLCHYDQRCKKTDYHLQAKGMFEYTIDNRKRGWVGEVLQVGFTSTETLSVSLIGSISFDATSDMSENVS